uniref:Uncharacterized protein n=1 Tax=Meloidogyne hapla TaxID=6305 RepID=A0A1I8BCK7_MELHA
MFNNLIEKDAQFFEECVEEYKDNNEQKLDKENDIIKEARERFNASYRIKSELDFDIIREILIVKEDCKYISENFTKFQKSIEKDCEELREVFYKFGGNYTGFFEEEIKFVYLDNLIKEVEAEEEMKEILKRKAEETEIKMSLEE